MTKITMEEQKEGCRIVENNGTLIEYGPRRNDRRRIGPLTDVPLEAIKHRNPSKSIYVVGKEKRREYLQRVISRGANIMSNRTKRSLWELMGETYLPDINSAADCYIKAKQSEGKEIFGKTPEEVIYFDAPITDEIHTFIERLIAKEANKLYDAKEIDGLENFCLRMSKRFQVLPVRGLLYPLVFSGVLRHAGGDSAGANFFFRKADEVNLWGRQSYNTYLEYGAEAGFSFL